MDPTTEPVTTNAATAVADTDDFDPYTLTPGTFEEIHTDWMRFHDAKPGEIDFPDVPEGDCYAYCGGKILGHGPDSHALRLRVAREHRIHPNRIYIRRVYPPDIVVR